MTQRSQIRAHLTALLGFVLLPSLACVVTAPAPQDGGSLVVGRDAAHDSGAAPDTGSAEDTGLRDSGFASDASLRADTGFDSGVHLDAGDLPDAALSFDAGLAEDAGELDSGVPDTGPSPPVNPLLGAGPRETLASGFELAEGPTWRAQEGVLLFSEVERNTIHQLTPPNTITVFRRPSQNSNGLANYPDGSLLAAEHGSRSLTRTLPSGAIITLADRYQGQRLNSPNDVVARSDGTIYFTDPPFGLDGRKRGVPFNGLFRLTPGGVLSAEWEGSEETRPNGVVLSADETRLYVANSAASEVLVLDVAADGSLSNRRRFIRTGGRGDGLAVDDRENVFVSTVVGIEVFAPDGQKWGTIDTDGSATNCTFGGPDRRTLYITTRTTLYAMPMVIPGVL